MALLAVQEAGARLRFRHEAIVVTRGGETLLTKPLHEVTEVHLFGAVELSARLRSALLRAGVDVTFFDGRGRYLGRLAGAESHAAERRLAQLRYLGDPARAASLARVIVRGKLWNQRALLSRVARQHPEAASPRALAGLRQLIRRLDDPALSPDAASPDAASPDAAREDPLPGDAVTSNGGPRWPGDALRGLEGQGAALYFQGLSRAIRNPAFSFHGRNRRPPRDPVNACLSFGYTLLLTRVISALRRAGLDPHLGALHGPGRGKPSLGLDLMEELRPVVVDRLVLRLLNRRQLAPEDFEDPGTRAARGDHDDPGPAVWLGPTGREIMLRELAAAWRVRYAAGPQGQRRTLGDLLDAQAHALLALFQGRAETYTPFVLR